MSGKFLNNGGCRGRGGPIHFHLDCVEDGEDGADEVELNDGLPGETFSFPLRTGVFHSKVCIGGDEGYYKNGGHTTHF